eukprot:SM000058S18493  [mRNA]  locus=s58:263365:265818:+ [translate_table: standard]
MGLILDMERPDLVVLNGDQLTANNLMNSNATKYWEALVGPCRQRGIPWAAVFGNHDDMPFEWPPSWFSAAGIPAPFEIPAGQAPGSERRWEAGGAMQVTSRAVLMAFDTAFPLSRSQHGPASLWPSVSNFHLPIWPADAAAEQPAALLYFLDSGGGSYPQLVSVGSAGK